MVHILTATPAMSTNHELQPDQTLFLPLEKRNEELFWNQQHEHMTDMPKEKGSLSVTKTSETCTNIDYSQRHNFLKVENATLSYFGKLVVYDVILLNHEYNYIVILIMIAG